MNTIIITGNITKEVRYFEKDGKVMAAFSVADNKKIKDKDYTIFHDCVAYDYSAKGMRALGIDKGNGVMIWGEMRAKEVTDKTGAMKVYKEVMVNNIALSRVSKGALASSVNEENAEEFPFGNV